MTEILNAENVKRNRAFLNFKSKPNISAPTQLSSSPVLSTTYAEVSTQKIIIERENTKLEESRISRGRKEQKQRFD